MTTLPDLQPTLDGTIVALRPLVAADWGALFAIASDPLIWAVHPAHDRWQEPIFRRFFDEAVASGGGLVATGPASGAVIGFSRYDRARVEPGEIEIGWTFLARSHWGGTTNGAMKALMVGHALSGYDRVIFLIGEENLRSRRAIEKVGAVLTDRVDEAEMAGATVRHVVYAIDRAGFLSRPSSRVGEPAQ